MHIKLCRISHKNNRIFIFFTVMSFLLFLESLKCLLTNLYSSLLHSIQFYNQARKMMHYYSDRGGFWLATRRRRSSLLHKWCDKWHPTEIDEDHTEKKTIQDLKRTNTSQNIVSTANPRIKPTKSETGQKLAEFRKGLSRKKLNGISEIIQIMLKFN